jgi:hypothetical protein
MASTNRAGDEAAEDMRMLVRLLQLLLLPVYLLMRCGEELSGEGKWYRQQRQRMNCDRPPMSDAEFLRAVAAEQGEEPLWLAVRQAVADSIGLSPEAVHPQDSLADLWRMQWLGPDLFDMVFRLERFLEFKIPRAALEPHLGEVRYGQTGAFHEFARRMVRGLSTLAQACALDLKKE